VGIFGAEIVCRVNGEGEGGGNAGVTRCGVNGGVRGGMNGSGVDRTLGVEINLVDCVGRLYVRWMGSWAGREG